MEIYECLREFRLCPDRDGHKLLAKALELVMENPDVDYSEKGRLYTELSGIFNMPPDKISHKIGRAVKICWINKSNLWCELTHNYRKDKPRPIEFILLLARNL